MTDQPPADVAKAFGFSGAVRVAETGIAEVWRCEWSGGPAALKVYRGRDMRNEVHGFDLLSAAPGCPAVEVYAKMPGAVLMEWLDGPSLGDISRSDADDAACHDLGQVAWALHEQWRSATLHALPSLDSWLEDLFALSRAPTCDAQTWRDIGRAQALARDLLATSPDQRPLHGDLHHDNVKQGSRGWTAFDAKGVLGDPTYEMANAFRNPIGCDQLIRTPEVIQRRAAQFSTALALDRGRLLRWAVVKVALSMAWRSGPVFDTDPEADLLAIMLSQCDSA